MAKTWQCKKCEQKFPAAKGANGLQGHYEANPTHKPKISASGKKRGRKPKAKKATTEKKVTSAQHLKKAVKQIKREVKTLERQLANVSELTAALEAKKKQVATLEALLTK